MILSVRIFAWRLLAMTLTASHSNLRFRSSVLFCLAVYPLKNRQNYLTRFVAKKAQNNSKTGKKRLKEPSDELLHFPSGRFSANSASNSLDNLIIRGARVHNLKNIDLDIPREKLI